MRSNNYFPTPYVGHNGRLSWSDMFSHGEKLHLLSGAQGRWCKTSVRLHSDNVDLQNEL